jgi:hypothetical protein
MSYTDRTTAREFRILFWSLLRGCQNGFELARQMLMRRQPGTTSCARQLTKMSEQQNFKLIDRLIGAAGVALDAAEQHLPLVVTTISLLGFTLLCFVSAALIGD